ncbi:flagellar export chaperone FliS [Paenibacillus agaridevorans]|uniref:Flagellar secretion chaperone FliS n=1 Tax=Paenibacillus agaridevorans TaxID=171404 RepID=A0A2R5ENG5_9BACL|nr:flagellar export chaperone FliS [Paenibacillus agaridevorans]GBG07199.1 flagellar export chaperone FliS [Paenibacillus agaridevorans]
MINPYNKYQESSVQTATPGQLIVMLYDGAIRFAKQAISEMEKKRYDAANRSFLKAQSIIHELIAALDSNIELSKNLHSIYEYMLHQLIQANIKKSSQPALEVIDYLQELRETWKQAIKMQAGNMAVSGEAR